MGVLRPRLQLGGPAYSSLFQGAVRWNGFISISRSIAILCGAVPSAASAYILARQLGGGTPPHSLPSSISFGYWTSIRSF